MKPSIHIPSSSLGVWVLRQNERYGWKGNLARAANLGRQFQPDENPKKDRTKLTRNKAESDMLEEAADAERLWLQQQIASRQRQNAKGGSASNQLP